MNGKTAKTIYVHVGPHKTGTTSIQNYLGDNASMLEAQGVINVPASELKGASKDIAFGRLDEAEQKLKSLATLITQLDVDRYIISQEDFSGDLPGRVSGSHEIYPDLIENLRLIDRSLSPHVVKFLFFVRNMEDWLRSVYSQHLRYRDRLTSFGMFIGELDFPDDWIGKSDALKAAFGDRIALVEYSTEPSAGINAVLKWVGVDGPSPNAQYCINRSPDPKLLAEYERINALAEHKNFSPTYKQRAAKSFSQPAPAFRLEDLASEWPPRSDTSQALGLEALSRRVAVRVSSHKAAEDLLPWIQVDLEKASETILPSNVKMPNKSRSKMSDQLDILKYHLRGKSELSLLHGLTISYLRRDTPYTDRAAALFHRLWAEKGNQLAYELSSRWLISTFQTFAEHGMTPVQREIGYAGFFYGNMLKIYEGERAIEQRSADMTYAKTAPHRGRGFRGLDRFAVGGTDLMLNTNAMALQVAARDRVAGLPLIEFLLRTKSSPTVFSRMDKTRQAHGIDVDGFLDTWSFFEEPK